MISGLMELITSAKCFIVHANDLLLEPEFNGLRTFFAILKKTILDERDTQANDIKPFWKPNSTIVADVIKLFIS
jgi:hypothetical protein